MFNNKHVKYFSTEYQIYKMFQYRISNIRNFLVFNMNIKNILIFNIKYVKYFSTEYQILKVFYY